MRGNLEEECQSRRLQARLGQLYMADALLGITVLQLLIPESVSCIQVGLGCLSSGLVQVGKFGRGLVQPALEKGDGIAADPRLVVDFEIERCGTGHAVGKLTLGQHANHQPATLLNRQRRNVALPVGHVRRAWLDRAIGR